MAHIYAMLAGTYTDKTDAGRSAGSVEKPEDVQGILNFLQNPNHSMGGSGDKAGKQGFFGLNPAKNPTFSIDGFKPMRSATPDADYPKVYPDGIISIKLVRNRDKTPLKTDYITAYKIMLHEKGHPNNKHELSGFTFSMQDGVLTASGQVSGLPFGKVYILTIDGTDTGGNEFIPARSSNEAGHYAFCYVKIGRAPEIKAIAINDTHSADGVSERVYIKKGAALTFTAQLKQVEKAQLTYELSHNGTTKVFPPSSSPALEITNDVDKDYTIDVDEFDQVNGGSYQLKLKALDPSTGQSSVEQTYHIYYDTKDPEVQITYPSGNLHGTEGDGLVIKGTAFDTGSGLADTDPVTVILTKKDETAPPTETVISTSFADNKKGEDWELQPITISEGKYTLTVTAKDKVGQEKSETVNFTYDKAAPKISDVYVNSASVSNGQEVFSNTGAVTVNGNIEETYGLKSFTITSTYGATSNVDSTLPSGSSFTKTWNPPLSDNSYNIEIKATDKADKDASYTVKVVVDTTAPAFENIQIATTKNVQNGGAISTNSGTVAIKGKIKETGSGVKKLEYQVEGDSQWKELSAAKKTDGYHFESSADIPVNAAKKLFLKVTDNAGWEASWECSVTVVPPATASITLKVNDPPSSTPFVNKNGVHYRKSSAQFTIHGISSSASSVPLRVTVKKNGTPLTDLGDFFTNGDTVRDLKMNAPAGNRTFSTKNLADGEYTITANGGSAPEKTVILVIDNTGPGITPITPQDEGIIRAGDNLQAALSDTSGIAEAKVYYKKEGGTERSISLPSTSSYKAQLPSPLPDGEGKYAVRFYAKDKLGNETTSPEMTVWNDTRAPELNDITVNDKPGNTVYVKEGDPDVTVKGKAADANGVAKVEILKGNPLSVAKEIPGTAVNSSTHEWTITLNDDDALRDGTHNLTIRATDKARKIAEVQRTVVVDRVKPTLSVTSVSEGVEIDSTRWIKSNYIRLSGTVTDPQNSSGIDRVEYSVDGGANWLPVAVSGTSWSAGVSLGTQGVQLRAVDKVGNLSDVKSQNIKYDTKMPTIKITSPTSTVYAGSAGGSEVAVTYTAQDIVGGSGLKDNSTEIVILDSSDHEEKKYEDKPNTGFTIPAADIVALSEGEKTVKISVSDKVGNKSAQAQFNLIVDKTPPTVEMLDPAPDATTGWAKTLLVGKTTLRGSFSDTANGSGIDGTYVATCKIGKDKSALLLGDTFTATTGTWTLEIADIGKYGTDAYSDQKYNGAGAPASDGKIYKVPLHITTRDRAQNPKEQSFFIMVDSDGKTPKVTIQGPQQEGTNEPDSAEAHNNLKKVTLGGLALFSGISQTTNPASGAKITEIQARFSPKPNFTESFMRNRIVGTGTVDWKDGDTVVQSTGDSLFSWSFVVDCGKFLEGSSGGVQNLYYSIRAKNDAGDVCEWTPARIIKLDKNAPSFENSKVGPAAQLETYVDNIFVKDGDYLVSEFVSTSGITKIEITSEPAVEYLKDLKTLNDGAAIIGAKIDGQAVFTAHTSPPPAGSPSGTQAKSGYKMKLPIKTAGLNVSDLSFKIKVKLTGGQSNGSIPNFNQFALKYDTTKPAVIFGAPKGDLKEVQCTATQASGIHIEVPEGSSITNEVAKLQKNLANLYLFAETNDSLAKEIPLQGITETSGKVTVIFKHTVTDIKSDAICVLIEKDTVVFDSDSSKYQVKGFAYDTGSGVKTIKASIGTESVTMSKFTSQLGQFVSFQDSLQTNTLSDGSHILKLEVTDKAGNVGDVSNTPVYLRNKPLKLTKVYFKTDLNGNGAYDTATAGVIESVEESGASKYLDARKNYVQTLNIAQKFTLKNAGKSQIKFTLDAGQSAKSFAMYKVALTPDDPWALGTLVKSGSLTDSSFTNGEIDFKAADFGSAADKIPDGDNQKFVIVLKDAASSTDTKRKLTLQVTLNVKVTDTRKPSVFIAPFYWNGEGNNSLASNNRTKGHIEIKKVSTGTDLTGESDVSGQVVLRGTAYHPAKLTKLVLTVDSAVKTATYASGSWSSSDGLTVKDKRLDLNGHWVDWEYVWTTGDVGKKDISIKAYHKTQTPTVESGAAEGSVGLKTAQARTTQSLTLAAGDTAVPGQVIRIVGKTDSADADASYLFTITSVEGSVVKWEGKLLPEVPTAQDSSPAPEDMFKYYYLYPVGYKTESPHTNEPVYNKPSISVNVVPYITALKREKKYNTHRSSSGAYNLLRGDTVTVEGFNLTGTVKATVPGAAEATLSGSTFTLSTDAKSGKVKITVQPSGSTTAVEAVNNLTNNSKPYNRQIKDNKPETLYWIDDIEAHIWKDDETFPGSNNPKYPSMAIGSNGDLYAAYSNYSEAKVYYSNLGKPLNSQQKIYSTSENKWVPNPAANPKQVFAGYDPPEEAAISVTGTATVNILYSANYHGGNDYDWDKNAAGAGGLYCYDADAPVVTMKAATTYDPAKTGQFHRFELFYHNQQLQQFKNFRISRGNNNRIHVAYYDTLSYSIKYATVMNNAQGDDSHEYPWLNLDGGKDNDDTGAYTGGSSAVLEGGQFESIARSESTAEYCALALDKLNRPIVVYADVNTGVLRLAWANSETPTAAANWKVQKVLPAGDDNEGLAADYFAAQFDSAGYLHIVFRNTKGQICYVKSKNKNTGTTFTAYTFEKSVVVAENGSWVELTMDGTVPYIAYLRKTNTYDGIQIAYYDANLVKKWKADGSEDEKGAWNIMTAAMQNRSSAARACVAVAPSAVTDWKAAVGYTPGNIYRVVKYVGK